MRPIDADALKTTVDLECLCLTRYYDEESYLAGVCDVLACVDAAPIIEAEPIKHGRWIDTNLKSYGATVFKCSECGGEVDEMPLRFYHYCPNCGAKMDEVDNET